MARKPSNRSRIEQLVEAWEPVVQKAFFDAIADIVNRAELARIVERLERGDIAGAIAAVHLDPVAFRTLDTAIAQAFNAGGASEISALPTLRDPTGGRMVLRWDARNVRAEAWLRYYSSELITRINDDQRNAIRAVLVQGMTDGRSPRSVALDIIGRVNRATGKRTGGVVGLTSQQSAWVAKYRSALLSGDVDAMREYLGLKMRDRRFDATVIKAINAGASIPQDMTSKIIGRLSDRYLELRGRTIAHHETMQALGQSSIEAMQQAIDSGAVNADAVTGTWHTARDKRVRDTHAAQDLVSVPFGQAFPNGQRYPHDPAGGASESIGCRCWLEQRIDFTAGLIAEERRLAGL